MYKLPEKNDFKYGGQFQNIKLKYGKPLPMELMSFVFPDFTKILFKETTPPSKKTLKMVSQYCISTQKTAKKEDRLLKSKQKKEFELKQLEEKIRDYFENYYKNLYKNCSCKLN